MELQSFLVQLHLCMFLFMGDRTFPSMAPASYTPWCSHSVQCFYSFPWTWANFVINMINTVTSKKNMSWKVKYVHSTFLSINFGIPVLLLERSNHMGEGIYCCGPSWASRQQPVMLAGCVHNASNFQLLSHTWRDAEWRQSVPSEAALIQRHQQNKWCCIKS